MWSRSELKDNAKIVLKQCYWKAVLVSLVLTIAIGGAGAGAGSSAGNKSDEGAFSSLLQSNDAGFVAFVLSMVLAFSLITMVVGFVVDIFLLSPLEVNARRFFVISRVQPADLKELGFCFKNGYLNVVKIQFLRGLFTSLWTLLFIVPGIIKSYEYRMIPYILAENPDMNSKDAFQMSRDMMQGEKWNAFVLDLSFFGWYILSFFTCGILAVFYVSPYINFTNVELYNVLKGKVLGNNGNTMN